MLPSDFTEYGAFATCMPCAQIPGVFGSSLVSQSEVKRRSQGNGSYHIAGESTTARPIGL